MQILAEVMRLTNEARKDKYNTNVYQKDVEKIFLAPEHITQYQQQLTQSVNTSNDSGNTSSKLCCFGYVDYIILASTLAIALGEELDTPT